MAQANKIVQGSSWFQQQISLKPRNRGCHLVTDEVLEQIPQLRQFSLGHFHIQILHTSASLTLNENFDPDVRIDMEMVLNKLAAEDLEYKHTTEGSDDMPAHVKSSLFGSSLLLPIKNGKLSLGTYQGIWFCEHRNIGGPRKFLVTINGCLKDSS
uniref:Secondary thiamine-phosphate synthase enzyme n=1 Tax=Clastoptera arizonana TaxID=38151 RepID=A0A1B6CF28_9HEMI